ncbi:T9SS type A sorting domain-containing protein [Aurantibacillus circumpalustris]|uniref:T9SS type A sorting domain-containing protein n=1 Tax=Aurantibacillus circumpalustris TaxID=3036359 RepID=UPI00295C3745|nr:T9SS type A sorting domain-containing protein [Aurantibacillus circumpalustris]
MKLVKVLILLTVILRSSDLKAQLTFTVNNSSSSYSITCSNPTLNLSATSNFSSTLSYTWISPQLISIASNSIGITSPGAYTINATSGALSASQTIAIGINTTVPTLTLSSSNASLTCLTHTVLVSGIVSPTNVQISWVEPFTEFPCVTNTCVFVAAGTYHLKITDPINGCANSGTISIGDGRNYFQMSTPEPFLVNCPDGTVTISPIYSTNINSINFAWTSPINASVSGANTSSLTTNAPGTYTVMVTDTTNGCITKNLIYVYACVGINLDLFETNFKIFPNPVKDKLQFELNDLLIFDLKLMIADALGQIVYSENNFDLKMELDLNFLKSGIYYLKLVGFKNQKVFKLIKD